MDEEEKKRINKIIKEVYAKHSKKLEKEWELLLAERALKEKNNVGTT
jgi:hypothetical protein